MIRVFTAYANILNVPNYGDSESKGLQCKKTKIIVESKPYVISKRTKG